METTTTPRFERRRDDRMVGGVAAAIARKLDVPAPLVRLMFVISALAGGLGLVAYVTGVLLIPREGEERTPTRRWFDRAAEAGDWTTKLGWALVTLAAVILISATGIVASPLIVAAALVATGVALLDRAERKETNQ